MFQVYFSRICFGISAKYVFVVECGEQKKRTNVSQQWTSTPTFQDCVSFDKIDNLVIKACIVTHEKQIKIVGSFEVEKQDLNWSQKVLFDEDKQLNNKVQGKSVCMGRCHIKICQRSIQKKQKDILEQGDSFEIKSQEQEEQGTRRCQVRFMIHCGFNFYIGSSFKVQITWGKQCMSSKYIKDKITIIWAQNIYVKGKEQKQIEVSVLDSKNNKLEWLKILPKNMRIMFPYHLRCIFRQEFMGAFPEIYFTAIREDLPLYTIIERHINLHLKPSEEALQPKQVHVLVIQSSLKKTIQIPNFITLNLKNNISFDLINKQLDSQQQHWVMFVPVAMNRDFHKKDFTILNSLLNKNINAFLIKIHDWKEAFQRNNLNAFQIIDQNQGFQTILKQIYYHNAKFTLGNRAEILNYQTYEAPLEGQISQMEKWRILSSNYELRNEMIKQSIQRIYSMKPLIEKKGDELVELKKVLKEVKRMNVDLVHKQESSLVNKDKGLKVLLGKYSVEDIISTLYRKLEELSELKSITSEMRMRIQTVEAYEQNFDELDQIIVENAKKLLIQQNQIKKMNLIKEIVGKQRVTIAKLQKIFQQRQLDKQMNILLQNQSIKLEEIRTRKRQNLQRVYETIMTKQKLPVSLKQKCIQAERQLTLLNQEFARLQFSK